MLLNDLMALFPLRCLPPLMRPFSWCAWEVSEWFLYNFGLPDLVGGHAFRNCRRRDVREFLYKERRHTNIGACVITFWGRLSFFTFLHWHVFFVRERAIGIKTYFSGGC